jgi:hypothetical protein
LLQALLNASVPGKFFDSDNDSVNDFKSFSCFLSKFDGVSTTTLQRMSPRLLFLTTVAPLPLILNTFPVCVCAGIFNEIEPSNVGICIDPPKIDTSKGIGDSMYKSLPSLSNKGFSKTLIAT